MTTRSRRGPTAADAPCSSRAFAGIPQKKPSTTAAKPNPMTAIFRREVAIMLGSCPSDIRSMFPNGQVETLGMMERMSTTGLQETVQLKRIEGTQEMWVTRTEGGREWFPRSARVQKRLRGNEEEVEQDEDELDDEQERDGEEERTRRRSKRRTSTSQRDDDDDAEFETPVNATRRHSSSSTRSKAPRKKKTSTRRTAAAVDTDMTMIDENEQVDVFGPRGGNDEDEQGDETEREDGARERGSVDGKRTSKHVSTRRSKSKASSSSSGSSKRRTRSSSVAARAVLESEDNESAGGGDALAAQMTEDDLASLCGRVDNLDVQSSLDAESVTGGIPSLDDVTAPDSLK
ncbi:hypothetical protein ACM66B_007121 [Microbotryomycetes sp. NB124-2]